MTSTTWIKRIETAALESQNIPTWGALPSFPWELFAKHLSESLGIENLSITPTASDWENSDDLYTGMGTNPIHTTITTPSLTGPITLAFPANDVDTLTTWAINTDSVTQPFVDRSLTQGFFYYLSMETIHILDNLDLFNNLTFQLSDLPPIKEAAYCIDLSISYNSSTVCGRILISKDFQQSFKEFYSKKWNFKTPSSLYTTLHIPLSLLAGGVSITQEEWKSIEPNSFIILDQAFYSPSQKKGTLQLCTGDSPLFQTKLKDNTIKILDYAHYFKELSMHKEHPHDPSESYDASSSNLETASDQPIIEPEKVPINISIKIGSLKMSLDKLLKLKPGDVLDLGINSHQALLMVDNDCIGTGELLQIGDVIGIKVTKIGE